MGTPPLIWLEVVLGFAVPVGWGVWQLISLRRDQRQADARRLTGLTEAQSQTRPPPAPDN